MKIKYISRVIQKKIVQDMIKTLREAGLCVEKINGGYECDVKGVMVFKAMNGSNGYLVRMADDLFEQG